MRNNRNHWIRKTRTLVGLTVAGLLMCMLSSCASSTADAETAESEQETVEAAQTDAMEETEVAFELVERDGLRLPIPQEFADLVVVDTEGKDFLFRVSEKASQEAAKAMGYEDISGAGELFSIEKVSEDAARDLFENNIGGTTIFGKSEDGDYYVLRTPTDVRIEREDMSVLSDENSVDRQQWAALTKWVKQVKKDFLAENAIPTSDTLYTNQGVTLPIPYGYADLVVVELGEEGESRLFTVSEKKSIDTAIAKGRTETSGVGELFAIERMTREEFSKAVVYEMPGQMLFATDKDENCYLFTTPTDVRVEREDMSVLSDPSSKEYEEWSNITHWASGMKEVIIEANKELGLVEEDRSSQELDRYLTRMAFTDAVPYTISTTEFGPLEPKDVDKTPFLNRLRQGVYTSRVEAEDAVIPPGEYIVLNLTEENRRFDFFPQEGYENFVREVISGDVEVYYSMVFRNEEEKASCIMQEWYDALAEANGKK